MFRTLLKVVLLSLGMFVLIEASYRLIVVGPTALNPFAGPYTTLLASGFVKPGRHPTVYYELKPNLDVIHRGKPLRTNSDGLADKEYSKTKPENTYRIAIVGSSWTMPASVYQEEAYQFLLENELNAGSNGLNFEVINFGVEQYGLGEMVGTLEHRVLEYDPDMVIMAMTPTTIRFTWYDHKEPLDPPKAAYSFWTSYVLLQFGIGKAPASSNLTRDVLVGDDIEYRFMAQMRSAMYETNRLTGPAGIESTVMVLAFRNLYPRSAGAFVETAKLLELDFVNAAAVLADGEAGYKVSASDRHPNPAGHKVIADTLYKYLQGKPELGLKPLEET